MSIGKLPNLRLLYIFTVVAKHQGYARAQQELNLTISAISNYMSELEEKLGFVLCQRGRGGFALTLKGEAFLQQTLYLMNNLENFDRYTATLQGEQGGTLRLGVLDATVTDPVLSIADAIGRFSDRFPLVHINLQIKSPHALLQGILDNELDVAVGNFPLQGNSVIAHPLYREQHWLYCSDQHELFGVAHPEASHVAQMRMVTRSYWSSSDLGKRGFKQSTATVESMEAQLLLILSGKYIGYLPEHYALPWVQRRRLRALLPTDYGYQAPFSLIFRRGRSKEVLIRAIRDLLRSASKAQRARL
ncbi:MULTISPECIES: LysR family transcriptional regulator [Brenneria]|uniref:LysR family transcriptional regulator n=1 Tax=Brenneria nigrifluens DSM 30175 = ATCC 13028 TaxID=1121120 RepID=A0A2U1UTH8_9GAMM|nr:MULTISPECIES: LysR family transcriptional regulator [Brenneria]EHD19778.1 transcriptional regulator, LysR family [Brenneria sp. EniD312]PWC24966.1 LysR family transcriptional regulator [Brenneria nigrifluens DSM 30175 = ATCC 13028]QCR03036.1 LysR family transcriptional regulator [Brenneria nigrifluens DSM 30175 = ATCC 13028]